MEMRCGFLHVVMISLADLFFKGIQNTKLVNITDSCKGISVFLLMTVGGIHQPGPIEMNSMGLYPRF